MSRTPRARVLLAAGALACGVLLGACGGGGPSLSALPPSTTTSASITTATGPEGIPVQTGTVLAPTSTTETGLTIDGIQCSSLEQLAHQGEVHLTVYVHGALRSIPPAIGLISPQASAGQTGTVYTAGQCYYWLHTDAGDGINQVDSPVARTYTLGNFFDVWGVPLSRRNVAGAPGRVTAIVNGRRWRRSPRAIPLGAHTTIELAVGRPVPRFQRTDWAAISPQPVIGG